MNCMEYFYLQTVWAIIGLATTILYPAYQWTLPWYMYMFMLSYIQSLICLLPGKHFYWYLKESLWYFMEQRIIVIFNDNQYCNRELLWYFMVVSIATENDIPSLSVLQHRTIVVFHGSPDSNRESLWFFMYGGIAGYCLHSVLHTTYKNVLIKLVLVMFWVMLLFTRGRTHNTVKIFTTTSGAPFTNMV